MWFLSGGGPAGLKQKFNARIGVLADPNKIQTVNCALLPYAAGQDILTAYIAYLTLKINGVQCMKSAHASFA